MAHLALQDELENGEVDVDQLARQLAPACSEIGLRSGMQCLVSTTSLPFFARVDLNDAQMTSKLTWTRASRDTKSLQAMHQHNEAARPLYITTYRFLAKLIPTHTLKIEQEKCL